MNTYEVSMIGQTLHCAMCFICTVLCILYAMCFIYISNDQLSLQNQG